MDLRSKIGARITQAVCLLFLASSLSGCSSWFYFPTTEAYSKLEELPITGKSLTVPGIPKLHAWYFATPAERKGSIFFMHGNAQNLSAHTPPLLWLVEQGYDLFTFDYPGYGQSEGTAEAESIHQASLRAWAYASQQQLLEPPRIIFGQSLGASISFWLAAQATPTPNLLIAEAPFASYRSVACDKASYLLPLRPLACLLTIGIHTEYSARLQLQHLTQLPLILLHSKADLVVGYKHSRILYREKEGPKELITVVDMPHNSLLSEPQVRERLLDAIDFFLSSEGTDEAPLQ
jgi:alpha-beta hydrolase superfamily lysophospholipase